MSTLRGTAITVGLPHDGRLLSAADPPDSGW
jgi:hypothetical protein